METNFQAQLDRIRRRYTSHVVFATFLTAGLALIFDEGVSRADESPNRNPSASLAAPTPTQVEGFNKDFKRGRKLSGERKWGDAVRAFEAALRSVPVSRDALVDLGFAAFQAGDFSKTRAANEKALLLTTIPDQRAVILYNQGRVSEARGDKAAAQFQYSESLALRPNATVAARLQALGLPVKDDPLDCGNAQNLPFLTPVPDRDFCAKLLDGMMAKGTLSKDEVVDCSLQVDDKLPEGFRLAWLRAGDASAEGETVRIILVRQEGKTIRPITMLNDYWSNGSLSNDWRIEQVKDGTAAGRPYVWIKERLWTEDHVAFDDVETSAVSSNTLVFTDRNEPVLCFPEAIGDTTLIHASLSKDGVLSLRLAKGKAPGRKGLLGDHRLSLN